MSFLCTLIFTTGHAQLIDSLLNNKRVYNAVHIGDLQLPRIDGILDDSIWSMGEWQGEFTQQQPYGGAMGSESTYVKVLYDRSNLYVAIVCQDDEPEKIRNYFDRRDALTGDMTGIAIDSYYDKRTAFEFNLSAAGQKMDLKHLGDYQWYFNWDAVWDGATAVNDTGWVAEMRVPFSQLRYSNQEEHVWGMHVWRWIDRKKEEDQWQYIPLEAPAMVYLFGQVKGIKDIRDSRQVEFLPYALGSYNGGNEQTFGYNGGLDAKIGISSDYTLDLTVNPDFGQVEADPSVLNLTAFETFFEEKRPFFLEGNAIFDFEMDGDIPFYSRRIGSAPYFSNRYKDMEITDIPNRTTILGAAKFTGKSKKGMSLGLINGLTATEYAAGIDSLGETNKVEVAPISNYMAVRMKQEYKDGNSSIGGFFSMVDRFSDDPAMVSMLPSEAYSAGVDFLHHMQNRNYFIEGKAIGSMLTGSSEAILSKQLSHNHRFQRIDAEHLRVDSTLERLGGHGGLIKAGKKGGKFRFSLEGQYRSPGLNLNDMGYIRQSDYFGERAEIIYRMNEPTKLIRNYNITLFNEARWSFSGEQSLNSLGASYSMQLLKLWTFNFQVDYNFSHVDPRELRGGPALRNDPFYLLGGTIGSNTAKDVYGRLGFYHLGSSMENFGNSVLYASITWLPVRRIRLSAITHLTKQDHYQQYVRNVYSTEGMETIVGNIARNTASFTFRGEVFFTPEMSLQYYGNPYFSVGQYSNFKQVNLADSRNLEERFIALEPIYDPIEDNYSYDLGSGSIGFANPDFRFIQYRSNVVFRWEYNLGSTLYLVWSHDRSDWQSEFNPISDIAGDLFGLKGDNIFMLKLNFWFSL